MAMITRSQMTAFAVLMTALFATGCGKGFRAQSASETKVFFDQKTNLDYRILLEKPDFLPRPDQEELKKKSDSSFANSIQNVRLDFLNGSITDVSVRIKFLSGTYGTQEFKARTRAIAQNNTGFEATSANGALTLSAICPEAYCEHAALILTEKASKKVVQIDYARSAEFLKPEDLSKVNVAAEDRALLQDVIEYHLPITRHAARIASRSSGREVVDLLVISRPPVDESDESFEEGADEADKPAPTPKPSTNPDGDRVIELEATSDDDSAPKPTSPTAPTTPAPTPRPSESDLKLTSNPYDVFNITIPEAKLKNLTVTDPMQMVRIGIVPAESQKPFEPAFRIAVLAEAFVDQNVKIYRNACNIFVRSVMMLAGYNKGPMYTNANGFGAVFQSREQGLNRWDRVPFTKAGSLQSQVSNSMSLQMTLDRLPESYATVAQWVRPTPVGHVGFVARIKGKVYVIDASLDRHGPRKVLVKADQLLTTGGRKNLNLYGMKGIVNPAR